MMTRWSNAIGGAWVLAGALMFSIMNGFAKYLPLVDGPFISPLQTTMVRYCVALLVLLPFVLVRRSRLKTRHSGKYFIRTVAGLGGIALMFLAVTQIPLASATAIGFTSPIFAMIFALLLLRETVRKMRWVGATVGLIGAVIIMNPDGSTISFGALIAMLAAIFMGAEVVGVKWLSRTEDHAATIIFFSNAWGTGLALCLAAPCPHHAQPFATNHIGRNRPFGSHWSGLHHTGQSQGRGQFPCAILLYFPLLLGGYRILRL